MPFRGPNSPEFQKFSKLALRLPNMHQLSNRIDHIPTETDDVEGAEISVEMVKRVDNSVTSTKDFKFQKIANSNGK